MNIKIVKVTILERAFGSDMILLETGLPEATWPYVGPLDLSFNAARGQGESYVKLYFPDVPIEIIKPSGRVIRPFSAT